MRSTNTGVAVQTGDASSHGSMYVGHIVVHGEDLFEVLLVREDVEHPGEHIREEGTPFGFAGLLKVCMEPNMPNLG
jgi:hypothetical protein